MAWSETGELLCLDCAIKNYKGWQTYMSTCNCFAEGYCSREAYIKAWTSVRLSVSSLNYSKLDIVAASDPRISTLEFMPSGVLGIICSYLQVFSTDPGDFMAVCSTPGKTRGRVMSRPLFDTSGIYWCIVEVMGNRMILARNNGNDLTLGDVLGFFNKVPAKADWVKFGDLVFPKLTIGLNLS